MKLPNYYEDPQTLHVNTEEPRAYMVHAAAKKKQGRQI